MKDKRGNHSNRTTKDNMAVKTCTQAMNVWLRLQPYLLPCKELSFLRQLSQYSQRRPNVGGASLHSLPGNRFSSELLSAASPSLVCFRKKSTRKADVKISMDLGVCGIERLEDFTPLSDENLQT
ncbi:hypothetical protein RRG08_005199, partial [Elysia crispata]